MIKKALRKHPNDKDIIENTITDMNELKAQDLVTELRRIYDDDDRVVLAVLSCVSDYASDITELLDFIRNGNDVTQETVSVYAAELDDKRNPEEYRCGYHCRFNV